MTTADAPTSRPGATSDGPATGSAPTPAHHDAAHDAPTGLDPKRVNIVLAILVVSAMAMILNETILSVALPAIMSDFSVSADIAQWLTTGFMLTMAIVIPVTGFMLQRFTTKAMFVVAVSLFVAGTLMAALAPAFAVLLAARVVQACGTALILPLLMTVTLTCVAPDKRGTMMGLNSVVISVAPALGPTLSGFILNALSWRWLFWVMLPIALVCLAAGAALIGNVSETRRVPFDVASVIISALAFGGLVYGLSTVGAIVDGTGRDSIIALVAGAVFLAAFVVRQRELEKSGRALLNLRPFAVRNFRVSVIVVVAAMAMMLGTVIVIPIYLQTALGVSALTTGLLLLPGGIIQGVASPFIGRAYDAVGPRPLVIPGAAIMAGAQWWLTTLSETTPIGVVIAMHVTFCLGMALVMTPLMTVALASLPLPLYGHGSAIMNTLQQLAGAAGTAVLVASMTIGAAAAAGAGATPMAATAAGASEAFIAGGIIGLIGLIFSPFVSKLDRVHVDLD